MIEITLQDLNRFVSNAVDAGIQAYERTRDPQSDRIKQSDAKRFLKSRGFQPAMLQKWVDARLVTPMKSGSSQNSAVWYSLADIKKAICIVRLKEMCNQ